MVRYRDIGTSSSMLYYIGRYIVPILMKLIGLCFQLYIKIWYILFLMMMMVQQHSYYTSSASTIIIKIKYICAMMRWYSTVAYSGLINLVILSPITIYPTYSFDRVSLPKTRKWNSTPWDNSNNFWIWSKWYIYPARCRDFIVF